MDATTKAAIQNAMTRRRAAQFKLLTELVGIDTSNPPGDLAEQAERIGKLLEALGFEVERLKVPKEIAARRNRAAVTNLVARRRFSESGPTVALVTAVDTVPVEDDWTHDPFAGEIKNGVIHGRGVLSGKADLTAQAFAVVALAESAANLTGSVELHVSFDGSGPLGCKWMLDEKLVRPDFVIGAGPARAIAAHSMGTLQIDVEIRGLAAPSHAPERGFDALEGANKVVALLHQYRAGLRDKRSKILGITHPSLVVEEFYAGSEAGGVPAGARFRIDRRLLPEEEAEKVETQLTRMIGSSVAKSPGLRCRIKRAALIPAMRPSDATRPLINLIAGHVRICQGQPPKAVGVGADVEGRHYAAAGIPCVLYGAGPIDAVAAGLEGPDEHLILDDLRAGTEVLALVLCDLLTPPPAPKPAPAKPAAKV